MEIDTVWRGGSKNKKRYTVVRCGLQGPVPDGLSLTHVTLTRGLITAMGGQDIPLDDAHLDKKLVLRGRHPDAVRDLLALADALVGRGSPHEAGA